MSMYMCSVETDERGHGVALFRLWSGALGTALLVEMTRQGIMDVLEPTEMPVSAAGPSCIVFALPDHPVEQETVPVVTPEQIAKALALVNEDDIAPTEVFQAEHEAYETDLSAKFPHHPKRDPEPVSDELRLSYWQEFISFLRGCAKQGFWSDF